MSKKKSSDSEILTKENFEILLEGKLSESEDRMKNFITENNSAMYSRIDPLLKEIVDSREDRAITTDKLEDHERRIQKLEIS